MGSNHKGQACSFKSRVMLTGASGFVGAFLCEQLRNRPGTELRLALRNEHPTTVPSYALGDFTTATDWTNALSGVDAVIHSAGLAHILTGSRNKPRPCYRETNTRATLTLARQAATMGVKRFIFLSSIGVNGSVSRQPFTPVDTPAPQDSYALSKLEAEEGLWEIQQETGIEIVIIRPPLVYGPDAPGNFGSLMSVIRKQLPLPLAGINNKRSFVSVWNLADLVLTCLDHPLAANRTFLARDGEDVSTSELLLKLADASGKRARLFRFPPQLLQLGATLLGKRSIYHSLFNSMQVNDTATRNTLNWTPPLSLDEGLRKTVTACGQKPKC